MTSWNLIEYEGMDGLSVLESDWRRLVSQIPKRGFQHAFEAHVAYMQHAPGKYGPFRCLALSDGTTIRAICPIETGVARLYRRETAVWMLPFGLGNVARDVICPPKDEAACRALLPSVIDHLRRTSNAPRWIVLDRICEDSCAWNALGYLRQRAWCNDTSAHLDVLDSQTPYARFVAGQSRKFRSNLRNARGKLNAMRDVAFLNLRDPAAVAAAFDTFLDLEAAGWKGAGGSSSSLSHKGDVLGFFRALVSSLRGDDRCEMNLLQADGRTIAALFCIRYGSEYAIVKTAYDETLARAAPGRLIMDWTIERCFEDPALARINFVSHQEWLRAWQPEVLPMRAAYVSLHGAGAVPRVAALALRFRLGPRLKSIARRAAAAFQRRNADPA